MTYNTTTGKYELEVTDTDGDMLNDMYEYFLEMDKNNIDTDSDGLSDYAEVFLTGTDPLYKDSNENGVLDCDEDADGDTLTNKNEIQIGTHPQKVDTDEDELADNYELDGIKIKGDDTNTYKTDPTKLDTDGDTLSDGDEALLGLNPLLKDSDGDSTPDNEEKTEQVIPPYQAKDENSAVLEVSLDINATGNAAKTTTIENVMDVEAYSSNVVGLIGEPFRVETTSKFDTATLTFKVDKSKLGSTNFNDIQMMWYNEETGFYEYFDTICDEANSTVSTVTTHFCTIVIVDKKVWESCWSEDLYSSYKDTKETKYNFNTLIAVDTSYNILNNDPINVVDCSPAGGSGYKKFRHECARWDIIEKYLSDFESFNSNHSERYKVGICTFNFQVEDSIELENGNIFTPQFKSNYSYDPMAKEHFESEILDNKRRSEYQRPASEMFELLDQNDYSRVEGNTTYKTVNRIMFISDCADISESECTYIINEANARDIIIDTVAVPGAEGISSLKKIAEETGGIFCASVNEVSLTSTYSDELSQYLDLSVDSDTDGIADLFEIAGMKCTNGQTLYTNEKTTDSDYDGLTDNEEVDMYTDLEYKGAPSYIQNNSPYKYVFKMISDPMKEDTDGDGYEDGEDPISLSIYNTGDKIEEYDIKQMQIALQYLGYLDMGDEDYGTYGGKTKSALNIYRLNHSILLQDYVDTFSYAVILNDYYLKNNVTTAESLYNEQCCDNYKIFSTKSRNIIKPILSKNQIESGITIKLVSNETIRDKKTNGLIIDIWLYDFSTPINTTLEKEEQQFLNHRGNKIWFYNQVKSEGPWDIKVKEKWNAKFENCIFISSSFSFVYNDKIINPEKLGNITYGYLGLACRFTKNTLLVGGHVASFLKSRNFDSKEDQDFVVLGYSAYSTKYPDAEWDAAISNSILVI